LTNFKGGVCKLDFPAFPKINFAAYFTGCQIFDEKSKRKVYVNFEGRKVDKKWVFNAKVRFKVVESIRKSQCYISFFTSIDLLIRTHLLVLREYKHHRTKVEKLFSTSLIIFFIMSIKNSEVHVPLNSATFYGMQMRRYSPISMPTLISRKIPPASQVTHNSGGGYLEVVI